MKMKKFKSCFMIKAIQTGIVMACCALFLAKPAEAPAASSSFFRETDLSVESIVRLHVLAHSNHPEDQSYKIQVVKQVVTILQELAMPDRGEYLDHLSHNLPEVEERLQRYSAEEQGNVQINVSLTREFFPQRVYARGVYPAGEYYAMKVVIGEGQGENWWCLIFPSLCLPLVERDDPPVQQAAPVEMQGQPEEDKLHDDEASNNSRWNFAIWNWLSSWLR